MPRPFNLQSRLAVLVIAPTSIASLTLVLLAFLAFDAGRTGLGIAAALAAALIFGFLAFAAQTTMKALQSTLGGTLTRAELVATGTPVSQVDPSPIVEFGPVDASIERLSEQHLLAIAQSEALAEGALEAAVFDRSVAGPLGSAIHKSLGQLRGSLTALHDARAVASSLLDNVSDAIVMADGAGNIIAANNHARAAVDRNGGDLDSILPGWQHLPTGEHDLAGSDATSLTQVSINRVLTAAGAITVFTWRDISEERALEDQVTLMARTDSVTGLANRQGLHVAHDGLAEMGRSASAIHVDLNDFDEVNQRYGYDEGDLVLREVADRLRQIIRDDDTAARVDGDSFVVLFGSATDNADPLARRVLAHINRPIRLSSGAQIVLGATAGWATGAADRTRELLRRAHFALREADHSPGGVCGYSAEIAHRDEHRRRTDAELRQAISGGQFRLYAQPIVDVLEQRVLGVEVFLRWQHPSGRLVTPAEFMDLADATGLICEIDRWVVKETVARAADSDPNLFFSMNVSSRFMAGGELPEYLMGALASSGLPAARIQVDVTETNVASDADGVINSINRLNEIGVKVALDDFGSGYSSLAHLLKLAVSTIKIDRRMVSLVTEPEGRGVISAILAFARRRGLTVVAEGVESEAERDDLAELGCRYQQGYLHGYPAPLSEILTDLADYRAGDNSLPTVPTS